MRASADRMSESSPALTGASLSCIEPHAARLAPSHATQNVLKNRLLNSHLSEEEASLLTCLLLGFQGALLIYRFFLMTGCHRQRETIQLNGKGWQAVWFFSNRERKTEHLSHGKRKRRRAPWGARRLLVQLSSGLD
jgi:hypothetical protein